MDTHLYHVLCGVWGKLSHQLEIEIGRYTHNPKEGRTHQLCYQGVESDGRYACHYGVFYETRGDMTTSSNKALAHYARSWNTKTNSALDRRY